ncbi:aldehyde oxidase GLOX isoform X2 [Apium graveolens]|uniref:aldehyde oxidase GLOX isoform X2 n=1 Tax=Apium graveolens TaxID=4045 RepID=UPI003D7B1511
MACKFFTFFLLSILFTRFFGPATSQWLARLLGNQGEWQFLRTSIGISAMHMQLLSNNKVVIYDRTDFGSSNLSLSDGRCRIDPNDSFLRRDCSAHSVMYDPLTNTIRPLMVQTDTWCSSGAVLPNGTLIQTGGFNDGDHAIRTIVPCEDDEGCDWVEFPRYLIHRRWSIVFSYIQNRVIRSFPPIPGDEPRNYPSSGSSVLLPMDENQPLVIEIMVCGGAPRNAYLSAIHGTFVRAITTCGRLRINDQNPTWEMETMPLGRVMGDMLILPSGDVLIINGAGSGTAGWGNARNPVLRPVLYHPNEAKDSTRFWVMKPANRPRLYHSTAILLPDTKVLVGGSNPHVFYNFSGVQYPTDLSLEAFSPPYLAEGYDTIRPQILYTDNVIGYNQSFSVIFKVPKYLKMGVVTARIVAPSFATHAFSMSQRMVVLREINGVLPVVSFGALSLSVFGPSTPQIAPPGFYMLFVVHAGIPSTALWVKLQ